MGMEKEFDIIKKPKHYNREGAMECIEEMKLIFGEEATANFCLLNVWKYRYRAGQKDGEDALKDLKKSDFYINEYKKIKTNNLNNNIVLNHPFIEPLHTQPVYTAPTVPPAFYVTPNDVPTITPNDIPQNTQWTCGRTLDKTDNELLVTTNVPNTTSD